MNTDLKIQDWAEFESALSEIVSEHEMNKSLPDLLKPAIKGADAMTDRQHRMIIAIFVCELQWNAIDAWKFIIKTIPAVEKRLTKKTKRETELSGLYQKINKHEASKLINILKSIARRKKK